MYCKNLVFGVVMVRHMVRYAETGKGDEDGSI